MPTNVRYRLRGRRGAPIVGSEVELFRTGIASDAATSLLRLAPARLAERWELARESVTRHWITEAPGTRPWAWWELDAPRWTAPEFAGLWFDGLHPLPRNRLGGIGTPMHEMGAEPEIERGLPRRWLTAHLRALLEAAGDDDEETPKRRRFTRAGRVLFLDTLPAAFNADDPPTYEGEAAYLQRHGLLARGEERRLRDLDFLPEPIEITNEGVLHHE